MLKTLVSKLRWYAVSFMLGVGVAIGIVLEAHNKAKNQTNAQIDAVNALKPQQMPKTLDAKIAELRRRGLVK